MPICTTCTHPTPYLYTVYQSAYNLRLEQCTRCHQFVDPYVEHDNLTLLLDLILLKRGVYRHLLFNRGYGARHASDSGDSEENNQEKSSQDKGIPTLDGACVNRAREKARWYTTIQLGFGLIFADAFIRWSHLQPNKPSDTFTLGTRESLESLLRIFAGCAIETVAFHAGVTLACALVLRMLRTFYFFRPHASRFTSASGIQSEFRLSHVPLTLLYSSLTKLFLLLLLSVWKPTSSVTNTSIIHTSHSRISHESVNSTTTILDNWVIQTALELLDEDKLDREWIVRNLLGGMAAGFGLRVVLDIHPVFTTIIVLSGWAVKTVVANFVHPWVGQSDNIGDVFLEYSIP